MGAIFVAGGGGGVGLRVSKCRQHVMQAQCACSACEVGRGIEAVASPVAASPSSFFLAFFLPHQCHGCPRFPFVFS